MQYINETNNFYDWLETNQLSSNAINLWHALMNIANKAFWKERFAVAISTLEVKTGLQRRTIERARNELSQKERIVWKKRNGNQSAEYTIISLCDKKNIRFDVQSVVQVDAQSVVQVDDIIRLDNTYSFKLSTGESKIVSSSLFKTLKTILDDRIYIERICMNNHVTESQMQDYIKLFFVELENRGENLKTVKDAKDHFAKWLIIQLEKKIEKAERGAQKNERTGKQSTSSNNESEAERKAFIMRKAADAIAKCNNEDA